MKTSTVFIALAAAAIVTGGAAGFASADDATPQDVASTQELDVATYEQDYSPHWFSASGYGPNDDQADETRALNRAQLENGGQIQDADDDEMQGASDDDNDTDTDQDGDQGSIQPEASPAPGTQY
ncbi:MAG: hypothetical protein ABL973_11470 [Micropepsaceae bacterium]